MGNNNNNTNTAGQPTLRVDQSSIIGEDGPLLFALTLGQNNNNPAANRAITNAIPDTLDPRNSGLELKAVGNEDGNGISKTSSSANDNGNDGPLIIGLLLNNQNNSNGIDPRQNSIQPCLGTLHSTNIALELKLPEGDDNNGMNNLSVNDDRDGPPLFVLLLDSQADNNDSTAPGACNSEKPKADTLDLTNIILELDTTNDIPLAAETTTNVSER